MTTGQDLLIATSMAPSSLSSLRRCRRGERAFFRAYGVTQESQQEAQWSAILDRPDDQAAASGTTRELPALIQTGSSYTAGGSTRQQLALLPARHRRVVASGCAVAARSLSDPHVSFAKNNMSAPAKSASFTPSPATEVSHTFREPSGFDHSPGMSSSRVTRCPNDAHPARTSAGMINSFPLEWAPSNRALPEPMYDPISTPTIAFPARFMMPNLYVDDVSDVKHSMSFRRLSPLMTPAMSSFVMA